MPGLVGGIIVIAVIVLVILASCIKIVPQAQAVVLERLGAYKETWNVGIHFKVPFIDKMARRVVLKEQVADFPPQPVITKDNVTMRIDTVIFFQITDPKLFAYGVENPIMAIENLTATTLRNIIGELAFDQTLTSREVINSKMRVSLDVATDPWGIKVNRVEVKNIIPPAAIQDAMEKQKRAELEKIEAVTRSEGQKQSAVLVAEGKKRSLILDAEAEKESAILRAEAQKQKMIREAEGQAEAIRVVQMANAEGLKMIKEAGADEAESEKEKMRANLLRAVSHDLRTPLTTIYGASSALLENENEFSKEQKRKLLTGIKEDSQWLCRMVENLLSVTRLDGDNVSIVKTPTPLDELIDAVLVKFHKHYPDVEVDVSIPDELIMVPMDPILMEQVIMNILENAVIHADGMKQLRLEVHTENRKVCFEITDDGCGIPEEILNHIFTGGYARQSEVADGRKGNAGIGLSVCATIIKAHGGRIKAENIDEGGACFTLVLDLEDEHEE